MLIGAAIILVLLVAVVVLVFAVVFDGASGEGASGDGAGVGADFDFEKDPKDDLGSPPPVAAPSALIEVAVLDVDAGVLSFPIAADSLESLDEGIVSLISLLLESPMNSEDSKIAVDIPALPDEQAAVLTSALIDAFAACEVPLSRVTFFVYRVDDGAPVFEVVVGFRG